MYEFLLTFGLLLWIIVTFFYSRKASASLFHPATYYLLVHGLVFVIRPILAWCFQYTKIYYAYQFTPSDLTKNIVLAGADLGFICFMAAALYWGNLPFRAKRMQISAASRPTMIKTYLVIAAFCLPVAVLSTSANIGEKIGGTATMIRDAATGYAVNTTGNGYFNDASLMLLPIVVVAIWLFRFRWWSFLPLVAAVGLRAATGSRWPFVMAFFSLGLLYLYDRGARWINVRMIAGLAAIGVLFTIVGQDRGQSVRTLFGGDKRIEVAQSSDRILESMDYANMEFFEYLVHVIPAKTGTYDYFLDNIQILTEPIPRKLWPGKPVGAPVQLYSLYDYGYPIGMTNSVPGEGWAQLGWLGIVIWCSFFGWGYGHIYNAFVRSSQTPVQVALYAIFMPLSIAVFRDGFLLTMLKTSLFTVLPILLWGGILRLLRWTPKPRVKARMIAGSRVIKSGR